MEQVSEIELYLQVHQLQSDPFGEQTTSGGQYCLPPSHCERKHPGNAT